MRRRLLMNVATVITLLGYGLFQLIRPELIWLIGGLLLWLSGGLLAMGLPRWALAWSGGQLMIPLLFSPHAPLLLFVLPITWVNVLAIKWVSQWELVGFGVIALFGATQLSGQSEFWLGGWCLFCGLLAWLTQYEARHRSRTQADADALRLERNRLAKLFSQSTLNVDAREHQATAVERQRLVHEIHDQLGHQLTGSLIQLQAAKLSYRRDPQQGEALLDQSIAAIRDGIEDIRQILRTEGPASQTVNFSRLKGELQQFTDTYEIRTDLKYSGSLERITVFHWQVLLGNLKEILTNTLKYSNAHEVTVNLHVYQQFLRFTVTNDGQADPDFKKGIGILGMEERTAALNGQLVVDGQTGFLVTTTLPLTDTTAG